MKAYKQLLAKAVSDTLKLNNLNQSKAAKELGMSRGCLREYMKLAMFLGYLN